MDNRQRALDLIALALDKKTSEHERAAAALRAAAHIHQHNLLAVSKSAARAAAVAEKILDPETIEQAGKIVDGVRHLHDRFRRR